MRPRRLPAKSSPERGERLALQSFEAEESEPHFELSTNIAIAYFESGRLDEAQAAAAKVARQWPLHAPAQHTLGQVAIARKDYRAAKAHFERALGLDPDSVESLTNLAVTQDRLGDHAGACESWARYAKSLATQANEKASEKRAALGCEP